MTTTQPMTTDAAVAALIAEGYAEVDVLRAVDRIIYNDVEVPDDDDNEISAVELDALRQELDA